MAGTGPIIRASFSGASIRIEIPAPELDAWCSSEQVGISAEICGSDAVSLRVVIEKDFRCLDLAVVEDQSDTFDNPLGKHSNCELGLT